MVITLLAKTALTFSTVISLLSPPQSYEIKNFESSNSNLKMVCGSTKRLYLSTNNRRRFDARECQAHFVMDSYYQEYLMPVSILRGNKSNSIAVCGVNSLLFASVNSRRTDIEMKKCQNLKIRARDSQYIYAGYTTPTCRLNGLNKPVC
jgi:ssDNA-binding Zn-finger/Zn-ribbon topoisomerase 1